jgi:tRNA threonylcarbamoyladenosine biosynthesis protein TsaE
MRKHFSSEDELMTFGEAIGKRLRGGEVLELVGDVGAGKTTLTKAIARGMGIKGPVQSPTFTISNRYQAPSGLMLAHYDFYRLTDPGLMSDELLEAVNDKMIITVIEWADIVNGVLPPNRVTISLNPVNDTSRDVEVDLHDEKNLLFQGAI